MCICADNAASLAIQPITAEMVTHIETVTRDQVESQLWHQLHVGRITSSQFGQAFKSGKKCSSLVKSIINRRYFTPCIKI